MRLVLGLSALALLATLPGCPDRGIAVVNPVQQGAATKIIPVSTDIDILFVIDDSPSTADKQAVFVSNFPRFVQALDAFPNGRPNVHIGVVSTSVDIGTNNFGGGCPTPSPLDGRLQNKAQVAGCSPPTGKFIEDIKLASGARQTNYSGTLDQALSCISELGAAGCGFEAHFDAMKKALDGSRAENANFLRPGAYLAVIFLTDEDDCSVKDKSMFSLDMSQVGPGDFRCQPYFAYTCDTPFSATAGGSYANCKTRTDSYLQTPKFYYDFLTGLKASGQVVVAVLGGDPKSDIDMTGAITMPFMQTLALLPSCTATINGNFAIGRPGLRLNDFVKMFGDHGLYSTICQSDYSQTLADIGTLLFNSISPCLDGAVASTDIDPVAPGLQLDCNVSDIVNLNTPQQSETSIPRCAMQDANTPDAGGARPCWWVKSDPAACVAPTSGLELHVERTNAPPAGDNIKVECAVKP
jgi:hypothetical protein